MGRTRIQMSVRMLKPDVTTHGQRCEPKERDKRTQRRRTVEKDGRVDTRAWQGAREIPQLFNGSALPDRDADTHDGEDDGKDDGSVAQDSKAF